MSHGMNSLTSLLHLSVIPPIHVRHTGQLKKPPPFLFCDNRARSVSIFFILRIFNDMTWPRQSILASLYSIRST